MVRKVNLYEIKVSTLIADRNVDYLQRFSVASIQPLPTGEFAHRVDGQAEVETLPIYHIRELNEDTFIAMDPRLRGILEAPFAAEVEAQERRVTASYRLARQYELRIEAFNKMPWHKRVWRALREGV